MINQLIYTINYEVDLQSPNFIEMETIVSWSTDISLRALKLFLKNWKTLLLELAVSSCDQKHLMAVFYALLLVLLVAVSNNKWL